MHLHAGASVGDIRFAQGMQHAELIRDLRQVLPEFGHPVPALACLAQGPGWFHQVSTLGELNLALGKGKGLAIILFKPGLVIEEVHVGRPTVHEEEDDPSGPGGEECLRPWGACSMGLFSQEGVESESPEAERHPLKGGPAG